MKSVTSLVARNYRLQEWAAQIRECQNRLPGTSVKEWCGQHYVTVAHYYYRLREVRKACLQNIPEESRVQSIVPVPSNLITSNTNSAAEITIGKIQITVSDATSPELFEYSCAMKSHFRKFGNQMSGSGNHLCNDASLLA